MISKTHRLVEEHERIAFIGFDDYEVLVLEALTELHKNEIIRSDGVRRKAPNAQQIPPVLYILRPVRGFPQGLETLYHLEIGL